MRNLPFHPLAGSHTSILMSESADGLSVAATRQNAGRSAKGLPPRPPGCENAPAATASAAVIVACGSACDARLSHVAAFAVEAVRIEARASPNVARSMGLPLFRQREHIERLTSGRHADLGSQR